MENRKNLLVTLADKNYILQAKQLFSSVYWNAGWKGDYMLLAHEISEEELSWFRAKGILVRECKPLYYKNIGKENYPPVVLDTFYLFTPEFKKWKNIVYLDGDILVRASLDALTKVKGFASPHAMGDILKYYFYSDTDRYQWSVLEKKYNLNIPAFNCGIMAFSTDIIKDTDLTDLLHFYGEYQRISSGADPSFNLLFYKKWKRLPIVYDITPKIIERYTGIPFNKLEGIIIHLRDDELSDKNNSYYQEWKSNLEQAEFIDLNKIQKAKKWNVLKMFYHSLKLEVPFLIKKICKHLRVFILYKIKPPVINFFVFLKNTPGRMLGKIGALINRYNPNLYHKLRKIKGGK